MNKIKTSVLFILSILVFTNIYANSQYFAIVDAGSTGSRLHLYKYNKGQTPNDIIINEIKIKKNKINPGISSVAANPKMVGNYIKALINGVKQDLKELNILEKDVNFYLFATAGLRTVSPLLQKELYKYLRNYLKENTNFNIMSLRTIPGKLEGACDWIAYNYLTEKLFTDKTTGVLDMGGASFEVVFETDKPIYAPNDKVQFKIGTKTFTLYSHSYLGLGQQLAVSQFSNEPSCFPKNYPLPNTEKGTGNFRIALHKIDKLVNGLHSVNKPSTLIPDANHFVGISGLYYTATSKAIDTGTCFTLRELKKKGTELGKLDWNTIVEKYGNNPYLYIYYFTSAYFSILLEKGLGFDQNTTFEVIDKVDGNDVSWTLGALIYHAEGNGKKIEFENPEEAMPQEKAA